MLNDMPEWTGIAGVNVEQGASTTTEVMEAPLKTIKNWKTPGLDGIQGLWTTFLYYIRLTQQLQYPRPYATASVLL